MKKNVVHQEQFGCSFCAMGRIHGDEKRGTTSCSVLKKKMAIRIWTVDCHKGMVPTYHKGGRNEELYSVTSLRSSFSKVLFYKFLQLTTKSCIRGPPAPCVHQRIL